MQSQAQIECLRVLPNPASVKATVEWSPWLAGQCRISVFDPAGSKVIGQSAAGCGSVQLDIAGLSPGTYFVEAAGPAGTARGRLVKGF